MWGQRLAQLSDKQRGEAAALRDEGMSLEALARRYGVSLSQIWRALSPGNPPVRNRCRSSAAQFKRHKWDESLTFCTRCKTKRNPTMLQFGHKSAKKKIQQARRRTELCIAAD